MLQNECARNKFEVHCRACLEILLWACTIVYMCSYFFYPSIFLKIQRDFAFPESNFDFFKCWFWVIGLICRVLYSS